MQYALLIYENESRWNTTSEADQKAMFAEYHAFTESIAKSGHYKGGEALQPTPTATTVRVRDGKTLSTDGPFAETKEQLGGYYLIDAPDLDAALDWASKIPNIARGSVEVRPVMKFD